MKTVYRFDLYTGDLLEKVEYKHKHFFARETYSSLHLGPRKYVEITVTEGYEAEREFFNHFGDDSSWPDGWYSKLLKSEVTRASVLGSLGPKW